MTMLFSILSLPSGTLSDPETCFILFPGLLPYLRAPILQPVHQPAFLRAGKPPRQVTEPVQGYPLRLLFRRQLGAGFADMRRMARSGEFFVSLIFVTDLAVVPLFFHILSPSPPAGRCFSFTFILAYWTVVVNRVCPVYPVVLQQLFEFTKNSQNF